MLIAVASAASAIPQVVSRLVLTAEGLPANDGTFLSWSRCWSADGRWLVFGSYATNIHAGAQASQVYLRDLRRGDVVLVSRDLSGMPPPYYSQNASVSADGQLVAFDSEAPSLVSGDTNGMSDVFVFDRANASVRRLSVDSFGTQAVLWSTEPVISGDGTIVVFWSHDENLVANDGNGHSDYFLHDLVTGVTEQVNVGLGGQAATYDPCSHLGCFVNAGIDVSNDGSIVAFANWATNLVPSDTNGEPDVFVRDLATGTTTRVSVGPTGAQVAFGGWFPRISGDGRFVSYESFAPDLVPGDTNGRQDIFVHDRATGTTSLVSTSSQGLQANEHCYRALISENGRKLVFWSAASNLVPGDINNVLDLFVKDLVTGAVWRPLPDVLPSHAGIDDVGRVLFAHSTLVPGAATLIVEPQLHDPTLPAWPMLSYCSAKTNSLGCAPQVTLAGFPSLTAGILFTVSAPEVRSHERGAFFWGLGAQSLPFLGGTLCVSPPIRRTPVQDSGGASGAPSCTGGYAFSLPPAYFHMHALTAGTTVYGQFWSRDGGFVSPDNVGLTNAIQFTVLP